MNCRFDIVAACSDYLVIRDLGHDKGFMSVTNDAERVVERLFESGDLHEDQKLLYYDSEGNLDEILIEGRRFAGFKAYRKELP